MVLQYSGHVRGVPASHARRLVQSVLLAAGQLLGTTGSGAMLATRKAAEGLQRAGRPSYCNTRIDLAKLSLPFHVHGLGSLHHA